MRHYAAPWVVICSMLALLGCSSSAGSGLPSEGALEEGAGSGFATFDTSVERTLDDEGESDLDSAQTRGLGSDASDAQQQEDDDAASGDVIDRSADGATSPEVGEGPNLGSDGDQSGDIDEDGVIDAEDNCPETPNADQDDLDGDLQGDACDSDLDGDGVDNSIDNCPDIANAAQSDGDQDAMGDACDQDSDGDDLPNEVDNCPDTANPSQDDADGDGEGDACDEDLDGDGVANAQDNCPNVDNAGQADSDQDGLGDLCEADSDDDGVIDDEDNCVLTPNSEQTDADGDGVGDACEPDIDGDGTPDDDDNCPVMPNADQSDMDADGIGDACEPDSDQDNVPDDSDNCPDVSNNNQSDADGDGLGDACEPDSDMDGIPDDGDLFPDDPNLPGAADTSFIYPHTSSKLFALNAANLSLSELGNFVWPSNTGGQSMTDLALDSYGTIFGVSFSYLFTCHPETVVCTSIGILPGSFIGLRMLPPGTLEEDQDVLVAVTTGGSWYRLEVTGGAVSATLLGSYGAGYSSSGDAYAIAGVGTFAAVNKTGSSADVLVSLIPETGAVDFEVAPIGNYTNVWGLAGWLGRAYAFNSSGHVLQIDLQSGVVTVALETGHPWWGAGVATKVP